MRRSGVLLICCVLDMWCEMSAQRMETISPIENLLGVWAVEEIDSEEMERLEELLSRPLKLNESKLSELTSSGLFTPFQAASIIDYRKRHGDILSFMELSRVDGFDPARVEALKPFLNLYTSDIPGSRETGFNRIRNDLLFKGAFRTDAAAGCEWSYGGKYRLESEILSFSLSFSDPYQSRSSYPSVFSGNIVCRYGRGKVVAGDFNARFGQGLCLWNTMVLSGLNTPSAYMRKPSGISPTFSFTGSTALTGIGAEHRFGKWNITALLAFPGESFLPAVNVSRYGKRGQMGLTQLFAPDDMKTSFDLAFCLNGVNLYGEALMSWAGKDVAVLAGTDFMAAESLRLAVLMRCLQVSGIYGLAASGEYMGNGLSGLFSADCEYYPGGKTKDASSSMQLKLQTSWEFDVADVMTLKFRLSERIRTWGKPFKTHFRTDISYNQSSFYSGVRMDFLSYDEYAMLGYVESGYTGSLFTAYLRQGIFKVDDWDDRIYVYERDAPGNFTVPAYYGRGVWTSANIVVKPVGFCRLYFRGSYVSYPFMSGVRKKPGKAELKLQCVFRF